ncbi:MAG TPA: DUF2232 domain-containing protein [Candidatus Hydrogenedentes bacterium]|nr:DUF2232 domain-containing protein [Candidatus Hydrogenedentota bacterium]
MAANSLVTAFRHSMALAGAGLFCAVLSWAGANPVAPLPFVLLVAVYWATGRHWLGGVAVACAILIGAGATLRLQAGLFYGLFVMVGALLGSGIRRQWALGTLVATVSGWMTGTFAAFLVLHLTWSGWARQASVSYEMLVAQAHDASGASASQQAAQEALRWLLVEHWADVSVGLMFGSFLVCAALVAAVASAWVRLRYGLPGPRTTFGAMRPSEWFVWPAILCAVLWYVEQRAPNSVLRALTWNTAIGLAAIYWLNGLSIAVYAMRRLQPPVFVVVAVVIFLAYVGGWMLSFAGLFDTWWEFRGKVDRLVAMRDKLREGPGGGEPPGA